MDLEEDVNLDADSGDERISSPDNGDAIEEDDTDEEEQQFDITLAASHSYMGGGLVAVRGRAVLEAGWAGRVPALAHHAVVFPGETVPMLLADPRDAAVIADTIRKDKLFGLLCPDETGQTLSGYGAMCEVFEAEVTRDAGGGAPASVTFKALAVYRFRVKDMSVRTTAISYFIRLQQCAVVVLPEVQLRHPLRHARLACLDGTQRQSELVRRLDAVVTPWPRFVFEIFDYARMRKTIRDHFQTVGLERMLPEDPVSLSFWTASNLTMAARDRLALFTVDNALLRLHMECGYIAREAALCCAACGTEIAARAHVLAMSSAGVHGNYANPGGFVHDLVTVSRARRTTLSGASDHRYSWFPGYTWTIALCATCTAHVGWRFDALRRNLRPQRFYGLCRNYVQPRSPPPSDRAPHVPL